jgi:hypothetical protein
MVYRVIEPIGDKILGRLLVDLLDYESPNNLNNELYGSKYKNILII